MEVRKNPPVIYDKDGWRVLPVTYLVDKLSIKRYNLSEDAIQKKISLLKGWNINMKYRTIPWDYYLFA